MTLPYETISPYKETLLELTTVPTNILSPPLEKEAERYSQQKLLGEGAYGKVWKVRDTRLSRDIALKSFKSKGEMGEYLCQLEIARTGKLDHPGIPTIYDVGNNDDMQ